MFYEDFTYLRRIFHGNLVFVENNFWNYVFGFILKSNVFQRYILSLQVERSQIPNEYLRELYISSYIIDKRYFVQSKAHLIFMLWSKFYGLLLSSRWYYASSQTVVE